MLQQQFCCTRIYREQFFDYKQCPRREATHMDELAWELQTGRPMLLSLASVKFLHFVASGTRFHKIIQRRNVGLHRRLSRRANQFACETIFIITRRDRWNISIIWDSSFTVNWFSTWAPCLITS
jgi:hypothetical protein